MGKRKRRKRKWRREGVGTGVRGEGVRGRKEEVRQQLPDVNAVIFSLLI